MKRQIIVWLAVFIVLLLGCSKAAVQTEKASLSEGEQISLSETTAAEENTEETVSESVSLRKVRDDPVIPEKDKTEHETADWVATSFKPLNTETSKQSGTVIQAPAQTEPNGETEQERSSFREVEPSVNEEQEESDPEKSPTEESSDPEPEPQQFDPMPDEPEETSTEEHEEETEPEPKPEPEFDIGYWIGFAKNLAESKGLALNAEATECWDNPITANADCIYLERDLNARLNRYAGDDEITDVWIWYEDLGNQRYLIYIGYA